MPRVRHREDRVTPVVRARAHAHLIAAQTRQGLRDEGRRVEDVRFVEAILVGLEVDALVQIVGGEVDDVVLRLGRDGREHAPFEAIEPTEVAELVRHDEELAGMCAVARGVLLELALADARRERSVRELEDLARERAGGLVEEQRTVGAMIGDGPDARLIEEALYFLARDLVAIEGVAVGLEIVRAVIDVARVRARELVLRLYAGLVLDELERAAVRIL